MSGRVFRAETIPWMEPPNHFSAFSKYLVGPETHGSRYLDFRVSSYQPKGYAEPHIHERAEHVYYVLVGVGLVELDGERHLVEPHTTIFIPPGVRHSIANTGFADLVFVVVTSPPSDISR